MKREGFEFDLLTHSFIENRWETPTGKKVLRKVIKVIKSGGDVCWILGNYILEHKDNQDPHGFPYYPKDAMSEDEFWVLTDDDLRGIHVFNEDFTDSPSFTKKSLNYARFYNCTLEGTDFQRTNLTRATFEKCNLERGCFAKSTGYSVLYKNCELIGANFRYAEFIEADFSGSNLTGAYLEAEILIDSTINYQSVFDKSPNNDKLKEKPEILKAIRIAYNKAGIWSRADQYFFLELKSNRKEIIWNKFIDNKTINTFKVWLLNWLWGITTGYGVKPNRILAIGLFIAIIVTFSYYFSGNPKKEEADFVTSLYYSLTTFATLGYGDLHYDKVRWVMRLLSTLEALFGATLIATYVAIMARKIIRY